MGGVSFVRVASLDCHKSELERPSQSSLTRFKVAFGNYHHWLIFNVVVILIKNLFDNLAIRTLVITEISLSHLDSILKVTGNLCLHFNDFVL